MKILVVGAGGYLGRRVIRRAVADGHDVVGTATTAASGHRILDVRSRSAVRELLAEVRPDAVLNLAARMDSWAVTADGAAHVAAAADGARLVHVSSDVVHGGRTDPYTENDPPNPLGLYGSAKAAAETAVAAVAPAAAIVRTSLIIGSDDSQHIRLVHDLIAGKRGGILFEDEIRCPVHVHDLASALVELAGNDYPGVLNVAGPEAISRAELGRLVARRDGLDPATVPTGLTAEANLGPRASDVKLDISRAYAILTATRLRPASESVRPGG
ncbi:SDR family oxidoreductase [Paractinoplanes durhamensis]|uniref:dTDP-4-dehydrorhamnose reductase n=1 Tax=Paractinoplanes durhamensis TaxID=113563 RepID=A0ABQ3ZBZ1_9ACTN|nr:sugar nucleotide-binding protein [Actinoplanes durhamensis]GIE07345.1 dTDP-4-dehydrorhamnose reductase [Actinoplanes durhamensis]